MPTRRRYAQQGDACATAHAIELLGDRWTYPVIRELMLAPKRFRELESGLRGVTPAVLTTRLRELEAAGLIRRVTLPPPANVPVYELTDWARELEPTFAALGRWAHASPTRTLEGAGLTPDAAVQSMTTMAPSESIEPPIQLELHLHDARVDGAAGYDYALSWDAAGLRIARGSNPLASAAVRADSSEWALILHAGEPLGASGVEIHGDRAAVARVVGLFAGLGR
ncbi:helix-turn-helix domain-containing protein [Microbacterium pumilum]|uniref:Winged helix-turn-helix transcriptional regulator n=1 Tax=Microbacterium pumilum TaxID=344165 RepID=A0ABN2RWA4_9MICO